MKLVEPIGEDVVDVEDWNSEDDGSMTISPYDL